jgi:hypothetical protein
MSDLNQKAIEVKRKHEKAWMSLDGVIAVGIGLYSGSPAIIISVKKESDKIRNKLPESVEGIPVVIKITGEINAI